MSRGYQHDFSSLHGDIMFNKEVKERKANTMVRVLEHYFGKDNITSLALLDVGASAGLIDNYLAQYFAQVTGIDIDEKAIGHAKANYACDNLKFQVGDAMALDFPDNSFDVVVCSQVYEHVPDAGKMMDEIYRVLKQDGACYFAATNRLAIEEHHHHLPFLSAIPRPLGHLYLRLAGKGSYYYEKHLSYWGLKQLVSRFDVDDYTGKLINDPQSFAVEYMLNPGSRKHNLARFIVKWFYWLCPGYVWLLKKPASKN